MKNQAKSVLFLPFLQIPSGHHQAAEALLEELGKRHPHTQCEKVDILAYSYGRMESFVSRIYLKWIHALPGIYHALYQLSVYKNPQEDKRFYLYEFLFLHFMRKLISEKNPDLIICTHALPAYMVNVLKKRNELKVPAINVYTDYFIHRFWGVDQIDFHFVPTEGMKTFLKNKGVSEQNIYITGIPVHSKITKMTEPPKNKTSTSFSVLVAGGSMGAGGVGNLVRKIAETPTEGKLHYYILCGKNRGLYEQLKKLKHENFTPLAYISCKDEMNKLYDDIDAVVTKPGGVTISECLCKRKPIFIHEALPGQEVINLQQLNELGVVFQLNKENIHEQILSILQNENEMEQYQSQVSNFHSQLCREEPADILGALLNREFHTPNTVK